METIELLKALGDPTRLRMINLLLKGRLCVCEIESILQITQSNASRHLTRLRTTNLIVAEKQAQWVYYAINQQTLSQNPFIAVLFEQELKQNKTLAGDLIRLKNSKESADRCVPLPSL
ncbi:winged helix-turn-helix transcriptional regulator [Heliobacterium chlorum]|uniref:Winged helix-turn-helix transcriptional regulator n=1 Tax=Heliobacterium chlorum TaxID=2698 RepID=A0ABR7T3R4_HELCL|nr:metalloregulator ArsR/SmtB family transcription factor [Heliobacterium chlorum]MBC9784316.1 winged helix-turn-helix transcriptional regulator [Heliobacterium chlorum]